MRSHSELLLGEGKTIILNQLILLIDDDRQGRGGRQRKKSWTIRNEYVLFLFFLMCEEWGDKSQIAAIALAANYGFWSIIFGGALVSFAFPVVNCNSYRVISFAFSWP